MLIKLFVRPMIAIAMLMSAPVWSQENSLQELQNLFLDNKDDINSAINKAKEFDDDVTLKAMSDGELNYLFSESNKYITRIYDLEGVLYELGVGEFGKKTGKVIYVRILPTGDHYLNRFAKFLDRLDVMLVFSQKELSLSGSVATFHVNKSSKLFFLSSKAGSLLNKDSRSSVHEMLHSLFQMMWETGYDSDFLGYAISKNGSINSKFGHDYDDFVSVDEIPAYSENIASATRELYRNFVNFYGAFSPAIKEIDDILYSRISGIAYDAKLEEQHKDIFKMILTFLVSPKYSEGRDQKLLTKAEEYFGTDEINKKKFIEAVNALYTKEDLLSEIDITDLSKLKSGDVEQCREFLRPVIKSVASLYNYLDAEVSISSKLEYVLDNILTKMGSEYYEAEPSRDYEAAYKFKSNLVIEYRGEKNIKYYVVSFYWGDIEYTTLIASANIKYSSDDAIIKAAYEKITSQLNMVRSFKEKSEAIKQEVEKSSLLPVFDDSRSVDDSIDKYVKNMDIRTLDLKEMIESIMSLKSSASELRESYRDNIAVGVDSWANIIEKIPVKAEDMPTITVKTKTNTVMSAEEIDQANTILVQLDNKLSAYSNKKENIELLIKYLKWADENGKTITAATIRASLESDYYKDDLTVEQLELVKNRGKVSYVDKPERLFSDTDFRSLVKDAFKIKESKLAELSVEELAALYIEDIVQKMNKRWEKSGDTGKEAIALLLLDKELTILAGNSGLLDLIQKKVEALPSGSSLKRAYMFSLDTFMDLVSATSQSRLLIAAPDFKSKERALEVKKIIEVGKIEDFMYEEEYESKTFSKKLKMMEKALKEIKGW